MRRKVCVLTRGDLLNRWTEGEACVPKEQSVLLMQGLFNRSQPEAVVPRGAGVRNIKRPRSTSWNGSS